MSLVILSVFALEALSVFLLCKVLQVLRHGDNE